MSYTREYAKQLPMDNAFVTIILNDKYREQLLKWAEDKMSEAATYLLSCEVLSSSGIMSSTGSVLRVEFEIAYGYGVANGLFQLGYDIGRMYPQWDQELEGTYLVDLMYRDGGNWKTMFQVRVPESDLPEEGDEIILGRGKTYYGLDLDEVWRAHHYNHDGIEAGKEELDHNILVVHSVDKPEKADTQDVNDFIEQHYPNYYKSNTIALLDDLHKIVNKEMEKGSDAERVFERECLNNPNIAEQRYNELRAEVYKDAINNYLTKNK